MLIIKEATLDDITPESTELIAREFNLQLDQIRQILDKRVKRGEITVLGSMNDNVVAFASITISYKFTGETLGFFEDLFVLDKYRDHQVGTLVTRYLARTAWDRGVTQLLGRTTAGSVAEIIYAKFGAKIQPGNWWYRDNLYENRSRAEVAREYNITEQEDGSWRFPLKKL